MSNQRLGLFRRPGKRRLAVGLGAVGAAAMAAASVGIPAASAARHHASGPAWADVNIGIALSPPKVIFMAPYVAQAEGYFAKEHLRVHFISMPNGLQTELGTTAGTINFGFSSASDAIESAAANAPIHAVWSYGMKLDTQCISAPGITSAKQLVGQPVGSTGTDGFSLTTLAACLWPAGVTIGQTKPITMTRSEFVPALVAGRIKVAVFHADDAYVVLHQLKGANVLASEYKSLPLWWYGGVTALDSYTKHHVSVTQRFLTAMVMADRWMNNTKNTNALINLGVKETQEDRGAVAYAVKFLQNEKTWPNNSGLIPKMVNYEAHKLFQFKEIDKVPSYSQIVDDSYIQAVLKKLGRVPGQ